jgi:hypothetical protein
MQDQRNKSTCIGWAMTTSTKVWIPFLVNTRLTCWQKELNVGKGSACSCSCHMWMPTFCAIVAKVSQTTSWVPERSLTWAQHNKWIIIRSMGCVHTHWGKLAIKGCGSPSLIWNVVEKLGENNQKLVKFGQAIN